MGQLPRQASWCWCRLSALASSGATEQEGSHTMNDIKARVIISVLGSAATVVTLASVVGAGKKWGNN